MEGVMGRWVRRVVLLMVLVVASAGFAGPAQAGGPTSVLLSAPPKVVAAGYDDPAYNNLLRLVNEASSTASSGGEEHAVGRFVRATWLIHDMSVWRLDVIYPDAPGGPWIATSEDHTGRGMPEQPSWHRATNPKKLLDVLGSLGLLRKGSYGGPTSLPGSGTITDDATGSNGDGATTGNGSTNGDGTTSNAAPASTETQAADPSIMTGWRWVIPGFLLGAIIAFVATRLIPKRRDWELIDAEEKST
jgi:hypothetical protein